MKSMILIVAFVAGLAFGAGSVGAHGPGQTQDLISSEMMIGQEIVRSVDPIKPGPIPVIVPFPFLQA